MSVNGQKHDRSNAGPLVDIRGLTLRSGDRVVLDGIDLTINHGGAIAVVGSSGSGKTTLALALLGHLRTGMVHIGGDISVAGIAIGRLGRRDRGGRKGKSARDLRGSTVAYLGQDAGATLNPYRRVRVTLAAAAEKRRLSVERITEMMARVGLSAELAERYPHQLSGGQQQRVALAIALARRPSLLILDEPTSALDPVAVGEIRQELRRLRSDGMAMVWITHDLSVVSGVVDDLVVLDTGRLVEFGGYEQVLADPQDGATRRLIAAADDRAHPHRTTGSTTAEPVVTVRSLVAGHAGRQIFSGLDIDVPAGRCLAVIGPSGAGKSTLARCIAGLHVATTGTITLDGAEIAASVRSRTPDQRRAIALIPQNPVETLHPRHSIGAAIRRPLQLRGVRGRQALRTEVGRLLDLVGLDDEYAGRLPAELSGGQRQRVAIARALAASPVVLICDEVTSALDTVTAAAVLDLIADLMTTEGLAVIAITHDPHVVRRLADDVIRLGDPATGGVDLYSGSGDFTRSALVARTR